MDTLIAVLAGYGILHLVLNVATVHTVLSREIAEDGGWRSFGFIGITMTLMAALYYATNYSILSTYYGLQQGGKLFPPEEDA